MRGLAILMAGLTEMTKSTSFRFTLSFVVCISGMIISRILHFTAATFADP